LFNAFPAIAMFQTDLQKVAAYHLENEEKTKTKKYPKFGHRESILITIQSHRVRLKLHVQGSQKQNKNQKLKLICTFSHHASILFTTLQN